MAYRVRGVTLLQLGEFAASQHAFDRALALYDSDLHAKLTFQYGQEPRATILAWNAVGQWLVGHLEEADRALHQALAASEETTHVNTQAFVLAYGGCLLETLRGDARAIEVHLRSSFNCPTSTTSRCGVPTP